MLIVHMYGNNNKWQEKKNLLIFYAINLSIEY